MNSDSGTLSVILNQWFDQEGPNTSPLRAGLKSEECDMASAKEGLVRAGADQL
jgi:hypothetical protein